MRAQCCHIVMSQIHEYDHITMKSQCCHRTMFTMWCHYDVSMISKLWHHMYELFVRSQWLELTTSPWGHSVVTVWCHRYTRWPHHDEVTVLSQDDAHSVMSSWHHYDITIKSSCVWVLCGVTVILAWYHVLTGKWDGAIFHHQVYEVGLGIMNKL